MRYIVTALDEYLLHADRFVAPRAVHHGASDFNVVQVRVAALGRHAADATHGVLDQRVVTLTQARRPRAGVARLGRAGETAGVACATCERIDRLTGLKNLRAAGRGKLTEETLDSLIMRNWPRGSASMPARKISARYAAATRPRIRLPVQKPEICQSSTSGRQ